MANERDCVIVELLKHPFSCRSFSEKCDIVKTGRPQPALPNLKFPHKEKGRDYFRYFNVSQYEKTSWLAGSSKLEKIFCWPCLLFSTERNVWSKEGYNNLNNLSNAIVKHERSQSHLRAFVQLTSFGKVRIETQLDVQLQTNVSRHNEMVKRNREILKRLIDTTCFLATQELPFRGHSEGEGSLNKGNYVELLNYLSAYDQPLREHLESATVFRGTSNRIQNDLITAISDVLAREIKSEILNAPYVAILLDETSDISNKSQLATTLRYVHAETTEVHERFISFTDVSADRTANGLLQHVMGVVNEFNIKDKLVAQTYDGAAVMAGESNGLRAKVQEHCPRALFVHCFSHMLNLVLSQSASNIRECRIFFQSLPGLSSFFTKSSKRMHALTEFTMKRIPKNAPTRWNFSSRLVNTVKENREILIQFFNNIVVNSCNWDSEDLALARGFISFLSECETIFLLHVFSQIYAHTDILFDILQTKHLDIMYCVQKVEETKQTILNKRDNFDAVWSHVSKESEEYHEVPQKRKRNHDYPNKYRILYAEIIDNMIVRLTERFGNLPQLQFISLTDPANFKTYNLNFPNKLLEKLREKHSDLFDILRLKNELTVLYSMEEFLNKYPHELAKYMKTNQLNVAFAEVYKLAVLVSTIPSSTASVERSFSALKRIKTFQRSTQGQERLSGLALLSIEKEKLRAIRSKSTFHEGVIEEFSKQGRRLEFMFK